MSPRTSSIFAHFGLCCKTKHSSHLHILIEYEETGRQNRARQLFLRVCGTVLYCETLSVPGIKRLKSNFTVHKYIKSYSFVDLDCVCVSVLWGDPRLRTSTHAPRRCLGHGTRAPPLPWAPRPPSPGTGRGRPRAYRSHETSPCPWLGGGFRRGLCWWRGVPSST